MLLPNFRNSPSITIRLLFHFCQGCSKIEMVRLSLISLHFQKKITFPHFPLACRKHERIYLKLISTFLCFAMWTVSCYAVICFLSYGCYHQVLGRKIPNTNPKWYWWSLETQIFNIWHIPEQHIAQCDFPSRLVQVLLRPQRTQSAALSPSKSWLTKFLMALCWQSKLLLVDCEGITVVSLQHQWKGCRQNWFSEKLGHLT